MGGGKLWTSGLAGILGKDSLNWFFPKDFIFESLCL
jgi:hypothetical protein